MTLLRLTLDIVRHQQRQPPQCGTDVVDQLAISWNWKLVDTNRFAVFLERPARLLTNEGGFCTIEFVFGARGQQMHREHGILFGFPVHLSPMRPNPHCKRVHHKNSSLHIFHNCPQRVQENAVQWTIQWEKIDPQAIRQRFRLAKIWQIKSKTGKIARCTKISRKHISVVILQTNITNMLDAHGTGDSILLLLNFMLAYWYYFTFLSMPINLARQNDWVYLRHTRKRYFHRLNLW